jgi:hypothetical protein
MSTPPPLPAGWEERYHDGRAYYLNHSTQTTQVGALPSQAAAAASGPLRSTSINSSGPTVTKPLLAVTQPLLAVMQPLLAVAQMC